MVKAVEAARKAARKAQESLYSGLATVTEHRKVKDEKTKLVSYQDVVVLENEPCQVSFKTGNIANQSESAAAVTQITELFIAPELKINPGSKITVTQNGVTTDYTYSGVPAVYDTHQQIILDLFEQWA